MILFCLISVNQSSTLGLNYPDLTNINRQHRDDNVSLREMLAMFLCTQHVTWSLLSDALKAPTVELINLADSITGNCVCAFSPHFASVDVLATL